MSDAPAIQFPESSQEIDLDPVSLGILWDRLVSIVDEGLSAMVRASFSMVVRESYDLSVVLLDTDGHLVAQSTQSIPSFTGSTPATLAHMLRRFPPSALKPGDVLATNDPWMGTGHVYDISVMRPVFRDERIVAYTMSISHLPDIGGLGFGSGATEIYQEGLRLPVTRIARCGRFEPFIADLIRSNVRVPEQVLGDVKANVACNEVVGRQLLDFMDEYGMSDIRALSAAILARTEATTRGRISQIPDGIYQSSIAVEGVDEDVTLACTIEVKGDALVTDFNGTSACVRQGINVPLVFTRSYSLFALKCLTVAELPNNSGFAAPIEITAPEGSILHARPPSPTAARHTIGYFTVPLIFGTLAQALPEVVQADSAMINVLTVRGTGPDGRPFVTLYQSSGGLGAARDHDGIATTSTPASIAVIPTEAWERLTGVTVTRRGLTPDSGGVGAARGGLGQFTDLRNDTSSPVHLDVLGFRTIHPARGFLGGKPGSPRENRINGDLLPHKGHFVLHPGDYLTRLEGGGGGFGDPADRSLQRVRDDVRSGFVSAEAARRDYGVEV